MNPSSDDVTRKYWQLGIFALAMGTLEAIVVVYLRQLYYPTGFNFPLAMLSPGMVMIEWIREAATIVMLLTVGMIAGRNSLARFAWFLYVFAVWDLLYYFWLKVLLDWPSSLFTWDILFLIPIPWASPVLAPVICSITMILLACLIIFQQQKEPSFRIHRNEWIFILTGVVFILVSFIWDYAAIILREGLWAASRHTNHEKALSSALLSYIPSHYNWAIFITGEVFILAAQLLMFRNIKSN